MSPWEILSGLVGWGLVAIAFCVLMIILFILALGLAQASQKWFPRKGRQ